MKYSENYKLNKPDWEDQYNIAHWNENTDKIDAQMRKNQDEIESNDKDIATLFDESSKTNGVVAAINAKIPSQASAANQLADKEFVNSSIATNTANFIGTFNSVTALNAYSGTKTLNDYAFVQTTDSAGNTIYTRYKWNGSAWLSEYELNNTGFTAAQWEAVNSGATSSNIKQIKIMDGASESANGSAGFVSQPKKGDQNKVLCGDGTWRDVSSASGAVTLQAAFNAAHPVGETYTQYPQQDDPETLYNKNGVTSTWQVIDYKGAFFRAAGGNAVSFKSKWDVLTLQSDQNKSHVHSFSGSHTHHHDQYISCKNDDGEPKGSRMVQANNRFSKPDGYSFYDGYAGILPENPWMRGWEVRTGPAEVSISGDTGSSGSEEARPQNYTIRIWKRTA